MASPTSRTTARLRLAAQCYDIAESFNHITNKRKDLWGFIDLVTFRYCGDGQVRQVGIQVTGGGNGAARVRKILGERTTAAWLWLLSGCEIEVHDWRRLKPRGSKVARWDCKIIPVGLQDVAEVFG